jgi:hypothetical protein
MPMTNMPPKRSRNFTLAFQIESVDYNSQAANIYNRLQSLKQNPDEKIYFVLKCGQINEILTYIHFYDKKISITAFTKNIKSIFDTSIIISNICDVDNSFINNYLQSWIENKLGNDYGRKPCTNEDKGTNRGGAKREREVPNDKIEKFRIFTFQVSTPSGFDEYDDFTTKNFCESLFNTTIVILYYELINNIDFIDGCVYLNSVLSVKDFTKLVPDTLTVTGIKNFKYNQYNQWKNDRHHVYVFKNENEKFITKLPKIAKGNYITTNVANT